MNEYRKLLDYISYFADPSNQFFKWTESKQNPNGSFTFPYGTYSEKVNEFRKAVYETGFVFKGNYSEGIRLVYPLASP